MIQGSIARKKKFFWSFQLTKYDGNYDVLQGDPFFVKLLNNVEKFINGEPSVDLSFIKDEELRKKLEKQVVQISFTVGDQHTKFYEFVGELFKEDKVKDDKLNWGDWGATLTLLDGCGFPLERWKMNRVRPMSINFGELDYSSSSEVTVEVILVYDEVNYTAMTMSETSPALKKHIDEVLKEVHRVRQWLEAKQLPLSVGMKPDIILGWRVYIDNSDCSVCVDPDAARFGSPVDAGKTQPHSKMEQDDKRIIARALAGLQSLGIGKRIRLPIKLVYRDRGDKITAHAYEGRREEGEKTEMPEVTINRPVGANGQEMIHALPHEVGHVVFGTLDVNDQKQIRLLARRYPNISSYGNPFTKKDDLQSGADIRHWTSGNEWFADVVSMLARGELQSHPVREEIIDIVMKHGSPHAGINYKYSPPRE